jgi:photosystem II stability/assembly factor-like uncharacterized protein
MKTRLLIASFSLLAIAQNTKAQWTQLTSTTVANLTGISCLNIDTCFTAGASGNIRKTFNAGVTWSVTGSGSTFANLASIRMFDKNSIWIGLAQKFHHTANGGTTWAAVVPSTTSHTTYDFAFLSATKFIAVGGNAANTSTGGNVVSTSTNAGATWTSVNTSGEPTMLGVHCFNDTDCIAVGGAVTIFKSTDGGVNWVKKDFSSTATEAYFDVNFPTRAIGFAAGGSPTAPATGAIMKKTLDSGNTWTSVTLPFTNTIYGIHFVNADSGFVVCNGGKIWITSDAGASWAQQTSPVTTDLNKIQMLNDNVGYIVGASGVILKTTNAGGGYPIGIHETVSKQDLYTLYGNPSHVEMKIETKFNLQNAELTLFNELCQQQIIRKNLSGNTITIGTSDLPNGIYFFQVKDKSRNISGKFIVE